METMDSTTRKMVELRNASIEVGLPVPKSLPLPIGNVPTEMRQLKCTAVTCDPDELVKKGYKLRQVQAQRTTELMVIITMSNEDEIRFARTLFGVMTNISYLCSRKASKTWGPGSWTKVVVCIVADDRRQIHPRVLDYLRVLGVFRDDFMHSVINGRAVLAHMFEFTTGFALDPELKFQYPDQGIVPTQIVFLVKENSGGKINSHRWCLNAFAPLLQPNVIALLDVGTRPAPQSLYRLWRTFDMDAKVGGACGEVTIREHGRSLGLLNPLVAAQKFKYAMSNILDKPTEAAFGYVSVLPRAFSAYRYTALMNDNDGNGPLASYFKGECLDDRQQDLLKSNLYLAEERILCFEIVTRPDSKWIMRYAPGAIAETDVPGSLPEVIGQHHRWLHGSLFAFIYALGRLGQVVHSGHSVTRKVLLTIEAVYLLTNLVCAWFAIGNHFIFFTLLTSSIEDIPGLDDFRRFNTIMQGVYAALLVASFTFSMRHKPCRSTLKFQVTVCCFALLSGYMFVCAGLCARHILSQDANMYGQLVLPLLATFGTYISSSLLALDLWHLITCFGQHMLLSSAYVNVFDVYACSNMDDLSWETVSNVAQPYPDPYGANCELAMHNNDMLDELYVEAVDNLKNRKHTPTLPCRDPAQDAKDHYVNVRTNALLFWILSNGLLALCILTSAGAKNPFSSDSRDGGIQRAYIVCVLTCLALKSIIRFTASTFYRLTTLFWG